jgi:hypothetical protein
MDRWTGEYVSENAIYDYLILGVGLKNEVANFKLYRGVLPFCNK